MINYIIGEIAEIEENRIIVEANSMGFQIFVPATVVNRVTVGNKAKIYTYMSVKEDDISLYGFLTRDDLKTYKLLLGVNGIGPKAALGVLSALSADELRFAVLSDDAAAISKAPGIGKKTAQKLILELKDKLSLEDAFGQKMANNAVTESGVSAAHSDAGSEAVQALVALGYSSAEALRAVKAVDNGADMSVEQILKAALKNL